MDDFALFLSGNVAAAAAAMLALGVAPRRALLPAALAVLAVSSRHLLAMAVATQALGWLAARGAVAPSALVMLAALALLGATGGSLDLAAIGATASSDSIVASTGVLLLLASLAASFVLLARRPTRDTSEPLVEGVFVSVVGLVAIGGALTRIVAWLPGLDAVLEPGLAVFAVSALAAGALGTVLTERLRSFVAWLVLAQGGFALFAIEAGVHGRPALLVQLAASSTAMVLIALGLARSSRGEPLTLRSVSASAMSPTSRALVVAGALGALALPPFPGFAARLQTASALLGRGFTASFGLSLALSILLAAGSARLVSRTLEAEMSAGAKSRSRELLALAVVLAALLALGVFPGPLIEAARRGAAGLF